MGTKKEAEKGLVTTDIYSRLPQALNTRRRYSAFRPVPPPQLRPDFDWSDSVSRSVYFQQLDTYISPQTSEKANIVLQKKNNFIHKLLLKRGKLLKKKVGNNVKNEKDTGSADASVESDLERFLQHHHTHYAKDIDAWGIRISKAIKGKFPTLFVILLGVIVFLQVVATISFFAMPEHYLSEKQMKARCLLLHFKNTTNCAGWDTPHKPFRDAG